MAGYVYIDQTTACVCEPVRTAGGQTARSNAASMGAVAAAQVMLEAQAAAAAEQQRQRQASSR